ncbi:MAG: amidohydrolase family protein [Pseudomonadota bacterium]
MTTNRLQGNAVFPSGIRPVNITFDEEPGEIVSVTEAAETSEDLRLIFPGFIDIHVHAREYPRPGVCNHQAIEKWESACRKETFSTASRAAINGGVTLYCAMPNDAVAPADRETYDNKRAVAADSLCPVVLFAAVTSISSPWADLPYKVYLDPGPSDLSFNDWRSLEEVLCRYERCRVFFHAEDPEILARTAGSGPRWITRPPEAEVRAVEKVLDLTHKLNLTTHICHISTREGVERINDYNRSVDRRVTSEVTPHHLFFSVDNGVVSCCGRQEVEHWRLLESNPPLRSEDDRLFLLDALKTGAIDVLASDHAPHTLADKAAGAPGMPHLDTLGAFAGWLIKEGGFSPQRVAAVLSTEPARLFHAEVGPGHGRIAPGSPASFTVLDLASSTLVGETKEEMSRRLETRCAWSPFMGIRLPASVATAVVMGRVYRGNSSSTFNPIVR